MPKIVNERYAFFRKSKVLVPVSLTDFEGMLAKIEHPINPAALRAFFILLYFTGRRPAEIVELQGVDFTRGEGKKKKFIQINLVTKKKGQEISVLLLPYRNPYIKEAYLFAKKSIPKLPIFMALESKQKKLVKWKNKKGEPQQKEYICKTHNIYYWIKKFSPVPPYFLRHNRFSLMANAGATLWELMHAKGARSMNSVLPYLGITEKKLEKMSRLYSAAGPHKPRKAPAGNKKT